MLALVELLLEFYLVIAGRSNATAVLDALSLEQRILSHQLSQDNASDLPLLLVLLHQSHEHIHRCQWRIAGSLLDKEPLCGFRLGHQLGTASLTVLVYGCGDQKLSDMLWSLNRHATGRALFLVKAVCIENNEEENR